MAQAQNTTREGVSASMWLRLLAAAFVTLISFIGLINLASIVGHYGFRWHADVIALVTEYKRAFYPVYEQILGPIFARLRIEFTPLMKDVVTILLLAFGAANAESVVRDRRFLVWNVFHSFVEMFEEPVDQSGRPAGGMFWRFFGTWIGPFSGFSLLILMLVVFVSLLLLNFNPLDGVSFPVIPVWLRWWGAAAIVAIGGASVISIRRMDARHRRRIAGEPLVNQAAGRAIERIVFFLMYVVGFPITLLFFAAMIVSLLLWWCLFTVIAAMIAPIVAWRTVGVTLALFLAMMIANWIVLNGAM